MNKRRSFLATLTLGPVLAARGQSISVSPAPSNAPGAAKVSTDDIFEAAYKGDVQRATDLLKLNPAIARLRSADGRTPLHYAAAGGRAEMVSFLITAGADLSAGPESPLLAAVDYKDHAVASTMSQFLLMNASDPNVKRADGRSAVELATGRGYTDIVEMLVHRGATGPGTDIGGVERVYFAKRYSADLQGRPYTAQNIDGLPQDFINEFVRLAHFDGDRVKHLFKIAPGLLGSRATWDELAIEAAAHMGLAPLAQYLAGEGSPVSICTATLLGLQERVAALIKTDANCVRERGAHDIALIAYSAYAEQRPEIADLLLRSGASVQGKALGLSTLHLAASKGYAELAEVLLNHGADVNAVAMSRGQEVTPLAMAIRGKREKTADLLKSRGGRS
jgi:ankyrin repeat protein